MRERGVGTGLGTCQHSFGMGLGTMTAGTLRGWGKFFEKSAGLGINCAGMGGDH